MEYSNENIIDNVKCNGIDLTTKNVLEKNKNLNMSYKAVLGSVSRLYQRYQHLNKSKGRVKGKENLDRFMIEKFKFPQNNEKQSCSPEVLPGSTGSIFHSTDNLHLKASTYQNVAEKLASELIETQKTMAIVTEERDVAITEKDELNESIEKNETLIDTQKKALKRTANRETYWRQKTKKMEHAVDDKDQIQILNDQIQELEHKLSIKNEEQIELKEVIDSLKIENVELKQIENLIFFDESTNCYIPQLHACIYSLLDNHVSSEHVSNVIESVLNLCNKKANKLPCASTINNWSIERALIARRHISSTCENTNTTLHTDEHQSMVVSGVLLHLGMKRVNICY